MLITPSKNIRTLVKSPSKTPVFESIDDNFCMVKNVSPYRRNKHFVNTKQLAGLGGKSIKVMVKRIMRYLFTDNILALYSFNGRANKKKCFANLSISKVIFSAVKSIKRLNNESSTDEIEKYIKYYLIQAPFYIKKKKEMFH
ncbi:uncharacterized protein LOC132940967 [Metopolophium dirhodum]|uniref:uncharacterized protein LOC132940967 n=1 Tax=Metopolophium dirhodum TaxID=44670 RepID=UPI00298FB1EB|nr:uncharacterized protein LOC132940967 [Metopolophium dirhodum]XP_060864777.1 uncharacterized protein LOC132940967 [Metopolophium dirhodum]